MIIGGGIAGAVCALTIREKDEKAKITIISDEKYLPYRRAGIIDMISGRVSNPEDIYMCPKSVYIEKRIDIELDVEATEIDVDKNVVKTRNKLNGEEKLYKYDYLIIATGGKFYIPKIPGIEKIGVFSPYTIDDSLSLVNYIERGKKAFVVGVGFIGLKVAESLFERGLDVTIVVRSRILRTLLEDEYSSLVHERIERLGPKIITGAEIEEICGGENVEHVVIQGEKIKADLVVFATGVRSNVELAQRAGLKLGPNKAIEVNNKMETSLPRIYACGDCVETLDYITKRYAFFPTGGIAALEAKIAGANAVGDTVETEGFIRAQMEKVFGLEIISIGHGSESAKNLGFEVKKLELKASKPEVDPLAIALYKPIKVKAIANSKTNHICGAQIIGERYTMRHGFLMLSLIRDKVSVDKLKDFKFEFSIS